MFTDPIVVHSRAEGEVVSREKSHELSFLRGLSGHRISSDDVYSEHSKMQNSATMGIQMLSSGTKEPQRVLLPAGLLATAVSLALDRAALGLGGTVSSLGICSRPQCKEVAQADPRGLAGQERKSSECRVGVTRL